MTEEKTKKEYTVVEPLLHDGERREIGEEVALDPEIGDALVAQGVVKEPKSARAAKQKEKGENA